MGGRLGRGVQSMLAQREEERGEGKVGGRGIGGRGMGEEIGWMNSAQGEKGLEDEKYG